MKRYLVKLVCLLIGIFTAGYVHGEELVVHMHLINAKGVGNEIGTVTAYNSPYGLILTPNLSELTRGTHGFHVHRNANCGTGKKEGKTVPGLEAGGHYDPKGTGKHEGPYGQGHMGDLRALYVDQDGRALLPVLAPRLKVSDLKGHSLMIHADGDNYSDHPQPLGGEGDRVACGVVE
ncbi:MAG: superoxide dismutase [Candidatus Dadabacteria bacterium]